MKAEVSYDSYTYSGLHMVCDIKEIKNMEILNNPDSLTQILDIICEKYNYHVLNRMQHVFEPHGCTIIYMLSESHITMHTFPEKKYLAFDIYTCRPYSDQSEYQWIYNLLIETFNAKKETPNIIRRCF